MHQRPVVVVILLRCNKRLFAGLTLLSVLLVSAPLNASDNPEVRNSLAVKPPRYAEITPKSKEDVVELLERVSEYAESGALIDEPIVIMLHGVEARVFVKRNYQKYQSVVELARQLNGKNVIDLKICEIWMAKNNIYEDQLPEFIDPVPYGADVIDAMIEQGSVQF